MFRATPGRVALMQGMCSFPTLINWLKQREKRHGGLEFAVDVNAARYRDGIRETPNGEVGVFVRGDEVRHQAAAPQQDHGCFPHTKAELAALSPTMRLHFLPAASLPAFPCPLSIGS